MAGTTNLGYFGETAPKVPLVNVRGANSTNPMDKTDFSKDLSRDNPLPGQSYFDPSIEGSLIPEQAGHDKNYFTDTLNYGLNTAGAATPGTVDSNDPMVKALSGRYADQSQNSLQQMKGQNEASAPVMESSEAAKASQELAAVHQNEVQNFNAQYAFQMKRYNLMKQWQAAKSQAEAGLFGSIFGGLGAVGGALAAGPGGAIAGGTAGAAAGKQL